MMVRWETVSAVDAILAEQQAEDLNPGWRAVSIRCEETIGDFSTWRVELEPA
jgi:hypothetical protein